MKLELEPYVCELLGSLTDVLPLSQAMPELVPGHGATAVQMEAAERTVRALDGKPTLQAAVWLYVDELEQSHAISQSVQSVEGALWHAIMHRREGDFWNSKYWLRQAGDVSVLHGVYGDPGRFVDRVESAAKSNPLELVELQRMEWVALFATCARTAGLGDEQ